MGNVRSNHRLNPVQSPAGHNNSETDVEQRRYTVHVPIRPYRPSDRAACLAAFDSNVPTFFLAAERAEYIQFLNGLEQGGWGAATWYVVFEDAGETLACGGAYRLDDGRAGLAWGMVRRDRHRQGLGTQLLEARLAWLRDQPTAREVWLGTTQHSAPFFRRFGFRSVRETPNGYGPGMHRLDLKLDFFGGQQRPD